MTEVGKIIGILFSRRGDRRVLKDILEQEGYGVSVLDPRAFSMDAWGDVDLIIADDSLAYRYAAQLMALKARSTALLPVMVAVCRDADMSGIAAAGFDDVLKIPLRKAELFLRLKTFWRLQAQALELSRRTAETTYRAVFDGVTETIFILDRETTHIVDVNQNVEQMFGIGAADARKTKLASLVAGSEPYTAAHFEAQVRRVNTQDPVVFEWMVGGPSGGSRWVEVSVKPGLVEGLARLLVCFRDITEQKKATEQFLQAQKMESIGRLAGGVAHDLNNLLTPILGYSDLLVDEFPAGDRRHADIAAIRDAAQRARDTVRQLLAFSRKQVLEMTVLAVGDVVKGFKKFLRRLIREEINLRIKVSPDSGNIYADRTQIEQILMNLAVNAQDAMPDGGVLTIETAPVVLDEAYAASHRGVSPGPYVMIAVSDTGCGMDPETLAHIFEPFYTTKQAEKGTGLGLSTVYGIVKQHGGNIWVYSELRLGTTFKIYLPQVSEEIQTQQEQVGDNFESKDIDETVLVVEDNAIVRNLICEVLGRLGYRVLQASKGEEALEVVAAHDGPIDLLLTDIVMPGINGKELFARIQASHPHVGVLFASGYPRDELAPKGVLEAGTPFLQKPFSIVTLAKKVREAIDVRPARG